MSADRVDMHSTLPSNKSCVSTCEIHKKSYSVAANNITQDSIRQHISSSQAYMYKTVHLQCTALVKHVGTLDVKLGG